MSKTHYAKVYGTGDMPPHSFLQLEEVDPGHYAPWHRLHGTLTVEFADSLQLHVTAVAVDPEGNAIEDEDQTDIEDLNSQTGDGELSTITIDGREYVLWMVPYRD